MNNPTVSIPTHTLSHFNDELKRLRARNAQLEPLNDLISLLRGIQTQANGAGLMGVDPTRQIDEALRKAEVAWKTDIAPLFDKHESALRDQLWEQKTPSGMLHLAQARLEIIVAKTPEQTESDDRTFLRALIEKLTPQVIPSEL